LSEITEFGELKLDAVLACLRPLLLGELADEEEAEPWV